VKVIFSLPDNAVKRLFPTNRQPPKYLAYVEWFTPFNDSSQAASHLLYRVKRTVQNGECLASVIPLTNICRSIHLFPCFGATVPRE
jgi:hypothetical protein